MTKVWKVSVEDDDSLDLSEAVQILNNGGVVAFPTETVYGLGAVAYDSRAVDKIFLAKGRPQDNPLICHVVSLTEAKQLQKGENQLLDRLGKVFWPGPLTLVVQRADMIPDNVTAGLETVGIRIPSHPVALRLLRRLKKPLAAPSANRSGRPSPTRADHVLADLDGLIDGIIDGGLCEVGLESTVLDITVSPPRILRPGGITPGVLERVIGEVTYEETCLTSNEPARSPGMKYTHYSPATPLVLVEKNLKTDEDRLVEVADGLAAEGNKVGLLLTLESTKKGYTYPVHLLGSAQKPEEIAQRLFTVLREIDQFHYDVVVVEGVEAKGIGLAVMNRLRKAAASKFIGR
jgi:L-threonylcarbamoyladenylate synthase